MAIYRLVNIDGISMDVKAEVVDCDGSQERSPLSLSVSFSPTPSQKLKLDMGLYRYTVHDLGLLEKYYGGHLSSRYRGPDSFASQLRFVSPSAYQYADRFPKQDRPMWIPVDQQDGFMDFLAGTIRRVPRLVDLSVLHELANREVVSNDFIDRYFRTAKKLRFCALCWNESYFLRHVNFCDAMSSVKYAYVSDLLVGVYSDNNPNLTRTDAVKYLYKCMGWRFPKRGV